VLLLLLSTFCIISAPDALIIASLALRIPSSHLRSAAGCAAATHKRASSSSVGGAHTHTWPRAVHQPHAESLAEHSWRLLRLY
jgi:hypothetical protein